MIKFLFLYFYSPHIVVCGIEDYISDDENEYEKHEDSKNHVVHKTIRESLKPRSENYKASELSTVDDDLPSGWEIVSRDSNIEDHRITKLINTEIKMKPKTKRKSARKGRFEGSNLKAKFGPSRIMISSVK